MDKTCGTCRWWGGRISGRVYDPGPCRRYPPHPHVAQSGFVQSILPSMRPDDFCGEHQPKEAGR